MKRLQTLCLAVVTLALTACQKDVDLISIDKSSTFSPKVAREFFEERQNSLITRGASFVSEVDNLLVPYGYTPDWDKAEYFQNEHQETYEIPIVSDRRLFANRVDFNNHYKEYNVAVDQRILITRNTQNGQLWSYVMSVIPDLHCADLGAIKGFHHACNSNFSGLVLYSSLDGHLIRASRYENGVLELGFYYENDKLTEEERLWSLVAVLQGTRIVKTESTRGGDEVEGDSCPKCDNVEGCDYCTVYVTVETCKNCGQVYSRCSCSDTPPPAPTVPDEDPVPDPEPDPIVPEQGGGGPSSGGNSGVFDATITCAQNLVSENAVLGNAALRILGVLENNTSLPSLMREKLHSAINIFSNSRAIDHLINVVHNIELIRVENAMKNVMIPTESHDAYEYAVIVFSDEVNSQYTAFGLEVMFLHEMYHVYYNLVNGYNSDSELVNDLSHDEMLEDGGEYERWLLMAFPDRANEIDSLKYAGVSSSEKYFGNLPDGVAEYLQEYVEKVK